MKKIIVVMTALACALSLFASAVLAGQGTATAKQSMRATLARQGSVRVIVTMKNDAVNQLQQQSGAYRPARGKGLSRTAAGHPDRLLAEAVADASSRVATRAAAQGKVTMHRPFSVVDGFVATVDMAGLDALENDPEVASVFEDVATPVPPMDPTVDSAFAPNIDGGFNSGDSNGTFSAGDTFSPGGTFSTTDGVSYPMLNDSTTQIGAPQAWSTGKDGTGWYVAVLDTGVLTSHEMFTSKNVVEACFSTTDSTYKATTNCPNNQSSQTGVGAAEPNTQLHGTHVAGIAVGNNQSWSTGEPRYGVAPGADLIAVQIFSKTTSDLLCCPNGEPGCSAPCEVTFTSDQISGLEYVYSLRNAYDIASVNMSLGASGSSWSYSCDANNADQTAVINNLKAANIATVVASGNDGSCYGINTPACITSAIAVGSTDTTDTTDTRSSFSNFATGMLDVYAPGSGICSAVIDSNTAYECHSGTSMATPHIAGAVALIRQIDEALSVDDLKTLMRDTGASVTTTCSGDTTKRINMTSIVDSYNTGAALEGAYLLLLGI